MSTISDAAAAVDATVATLEVQLETLFNAAAVAHAAAINAGNRELYGAATAFAHAAINSALAKAMAASKGETEPALTLVATNYPA